MNGIISRGALIVLEGCDKAGKSTHANRLFEALRGEGHKAELIRFPDRSTATGVLISKYLEENENLDDHTIHLLFSANRWEQASRMLHLLHSGTNLIVDRYAYSGVAFSAAKGLDISWCQQSDVGLPRPDLVLFLDLPVNIATTRPGFGGERYEKVIFQEIVRQKFFLLQDENWKTVNADASLDNVFHELKAHVTEAIQKVGHSEIKKLYFPLKKTT